MSRFYAVSRNGISIHYKCYKLKKPFQKLCEYDNPQFEDCVPCKYFRAEMEAKDVERLMGLLEKKMTQLKPLTDKEQRIFLAAMGREEDVCKQVDAECRDCRELYEDSLVRTCHEIIRKVKGVLWT